MEMTIGVRRRIAKQTQRRAELTPETMIVALDLGKRQHAVWVTDSTRIPMGTWMMPATPQGFATLFDRTARLQQQCRGVLHTGSARMGVSWPWDVEQLALFLGTVRRDNPTRYPLFLFTLGTGLSMGEGLGLRWHDIDWIQKTATIRQTFSRLGRRQLWKPPKTESRRRAVQLGPQVLEALREVQRMQVEQKRLLGPDYHDHDLIFCQTNGNPLHGHNLTQRELRRLCKRAGVPRLTFHQLRHLHATYLALAGVPIRVAQERLGHSSSRITQEIYQHTLATQQHQAAFDVEAALFGGTARKQE